MNEKCHRTKSFISVTQRENFSFCDTSRSQTLPLQVLLQVLQKGSHPEKSGLVMEIFRKGSDPPPPYFGSYGTCEAQFNFGHKKGKY